jgi:iron complex transport system substrate-binding protein
MTKLRLFLAFFVASAAAVLVLYRGPHEPPPGKPDKPRIVSLAPNVTEILFALGLGDHIVGVTDACDYPPEATNIERVSGFGRPNIEKLLGLRPDLVIACGLERPDDAEALRRAGIKVLDVQETGDIADFPELFAAIRRIGEAAGRSTEAEQLVARMQAELDALAASVGQTAEAQRPRVFVEIEESPLRTAAAGSFLDDLVRRAGGRNVAAEIKSAYPVIDPEKVIVWNPQVIIMAHGGHRGDAVQRLAEHIGWTEIAAVREQRVIDDIDANLLFRPGPRLVKGVKALAARLHPK